ncbi:MAG: glucose-6-phosphate dehydrogenase, partial [bacterium]
NIFCKSGVCLPANEFVMRIQPDEALFLKIVNKEPGLEVKPVETELNLKYKSTFQSQIPDAYECLLLDVIRGDRSLFISRDELAAAWDIFTPVLHETERLKIVPEFYEFGSSGPAGAERLTGVSSR